MQGVIDTVLRESVPGDYVFVTPWRAPAVYALTGRRNPTHYDSLIDLCYRPSEERQREVCAALLSHNTRLVVHQDDWGISAVDTTFTTACPLIEECLRDNFEPISQFGTLSVLRRKETQHVSSRNALDPAARY